MISPELEKSLVGKKAKTKTIPEMIILGAYVNESAGLVAVVVYQDPDTQKPTLNTVRVQGGLELIL